MKKPKRIEDVGSRDIPTRARRVGDMQLIGLKESAQLALMMDSDEDDDAVLIPPTVQARVKVKP